MKALVIKSKWNCAYSLRYLNKEVEVVKCSHDKLQQFYRLINGEVLFHKEELIFE